VGENDIRLWGGEGSQENVKGEGRWKGAAGRRFGEQSTETGKRQGKLINLRNEDVEKGVKEKFEIEPGDYGRKGTSQNSQKSKSS